MNVLQTVKYYHPSKGGMESVVKSIVEGVSAIDSRFDFTVYSNQHYSKFQKEISRIDGVKVIKERTPFILKSQPLNLYYSYFSRLLARNQIIHHHYPFPNLELALLKNVSVLKGKQFIITWHANIKNSRWSWVGRVYNPLITVLLKEASQIVVTSPQLLENSDILPGFENKIKVIPLSFDPLFDFTSNKPKILPHNRCLKILFVGKLRKYKGVEVLLNSIKDIPVELTIVGDGEEEDNLKLQVGELLLSDRVQFYKNIDNLTLSKIYREADLFVLPSINEAEAFGVVQLEAMANGLPVINTDLQSGVPYVSLNNKTGYTVQPGSVDELKLAILKLMNNPEKYKEFSINSLIRAKLFTRENMAKEYLQIYNN